MYNPARDANEGPPNTPLMPFLLDLCLCLQTATLMIIYRTYHLQYYSAAFTTQEKHWTKIMIFKKRTWERKNPDQLSTGGHTATYRDSVKRVCKQPPESAFYLACAFYLEDKWEKLLSQPRPHDYWFLKEIILPAAVFLKSPLLNTLFSLNERKLRRLEAFISKPLQDRSTQKTWRKSLNEDPTLLCWDWRSVKSSSLFPSSTLVRKQRAQCTDRHMLLKKYYSFFSWILHECIHVW